MDELQRMNSDEFSDILSNINHDCDEDQLIKIAKELVNKCPDILQQFRVISEQGGLPATEELSPKQRLSEQLGRRGSVGTPSNSDEQRALLDSMNVAVIKVLGWAGADRDTIEELVEQFEDVIANSFDVEADVSAWFEKCVPTQSMTEADKNGLKLFLIGVAKKNRTAKKMARYGVGVKIALTLLLGYMDILTDFLVARSYYNAGKLDTAYFTGGFAVLAILIQTLVTFFQYGKKSWKEVEE